MFARPRLTASDRVAAAMLSVLIAGALLLAAVAYSTVVRNASASLDASLLREVEAFTAAIQPASAADERSLAEVARAYLEGRTGGSGGFAPILLVQLESGRVISNSEVLLEDAPDNAALLDVRTATRGFHEISLDGVTYRTATAPVTDSQGHVTAVFQAATPTSSLDELGRSLATSFGIAAVVVFLVGAVVSRWMAKRSLSPLARMADAASRVSSASLGERIAHEGPPDELGTLADTLNSMLERLERAFDAQKHFVADASHELRTPIAVIRGNVGLLEHPKTTAEEKADALKVIDEETQRMTRMLEDLLALARTESKHRRPFQPLEVASLLGDAIGTARALDDRPFACVCEKNLWVYGDPDLLERAVLNVLRNAIEHTPSDTTVDVSCTGSRDRVLITVRDHGPGITEEDLPRVFDRFFRSRGRRATEGDGSGLGLSIVKALVEMHRGSVSVANAEGDGAVFTFDLPKTDPPE